MYLHRSVHDQGRSKPIVYAQNALFHGFLDNQVPFSSKFHPDSQCLRGKDSILGKWVVKENILE